MCQKSKFLFKSKVYCTLLALPFWEFLGEPGVHWARLASQWVTGIHLSLLPPYWGYGSMPPCSAFMWEQWTQTQVLMFLQQTLYPWSITSAQPFIFNWLDKVHINVICFFSLPTKMLLISEAPSDIPRVSDQDKGTLWCSHLERWQQRVPIIKYPVCARCFPGHSLCNTILQSSYLFPMLLSWGIGVLKI